jgi:hypothetical protein
MGGTGDRNELRKALDDGKNNRLIDWQFSWTRFRRLVWPVECKTSPLRAQWQAGRYRNRSALVAGVAKRRNALLHVEN